MNHKILYFIIFICLLLGFWVYWLGNKKKFSISRSNQDIIDGRKKYANIFTVLFVCFSLAFALGSEEFKENVFVMFLGSISMIGMLYFHFRKK